MQFSIFTTVLISLLACTVQAQKKPAPTPTPTPPGKTPASGDPPAKAGDSVLSKTNIDTVLAGATSQSSLTIPMDARIAIVKLGTGGVDAAKLTAEDKSAISSCTQKARANNTASKTGLGTTGSTGNIAFTSNKVSLHACEAAEQQINGNTGSDDAINNLIKNVGVLNVNTQKAGITTKSKRAEAFLA